MEDKKIFDVTPPKTAETAESAKSTHKIILKEPTLKQDQSVNPDIETEVPTSELESKVVSRQSATIMPPSESLEADAKTAPETDADVAVIEKSADEPEPETTENLDAVEAAETVEEPEESEEPEPAAPAAPAEEKQEPIKELASVDSILPDDSQRATATAKDAMQSPTMYDTKAYYVPIGNSHHRHGHVLGAIIAGVLTAAVVVGGVIAAAKFL